MPSVQGGIVTAEVLSVPLLDQQGKILLGNRTLSYLSLKRWLNFELNLVVHPKCEYLMLELEARGAVIELPQGFQSMDISIYFQVGVLHRDC